MERDMGVSTDIIEAALELAERDVAEAKCYVAATTYEDCDGGEMHVGHEEAAERLAALGGPSVALARAASEALGVLAYHEPLCEWEGCQGCRLRAALQAWADVVGNKSVGG